MKIPQSSNYLSYGIHLIKLNEFEIQTSKTGTKRIKFSGENTEGASVNIFTSYLKTDTQTQVFLKQLGFIANAVGTKEEFENTDIIKDGKPIAIEQVTVNDLDIICDKFIPLVLGKFAWFKLCGEEKNNGVFILGFAYSPNHNVFVRSTTTVKETIKNSDGEVTTLVCGKGTQKDNLTFDENNKYDVKRIPSPNDTPEVAIPVSLDIPNIPNATNDLAL